MDIVPSLLTARMALNQQSVALSMIKQAANMQKAVVAMIANSADGLSASSRGQTVNFSA